MTSVKQIAQSALRGARRIIDVVTDIMMFGAAAGLCVIILSIIFEISVRFVLVSPTLWVSDLVVYLLLVVVFFAMPKVTSEGGHVAIAILSEFLPEKISGFLGRIILLVAAVTSLSLATVAGVIAYRQFYSSAMTMGTFPIPRFVLTSVICSGFSVSALHFLNAAASGTKAAVTQ
jgi:TRAP-type C4-dicarboxylate transport system permease small subunit